MLTFISAFLGLVVGIHPVELTVSDDIASVELRLDGQTIGHLRGEPWVLACDFGPELVPHELVAIGRDVDGREVARIFQWINLPRPRSDAELVFDSRAGAPRRAGVVWHSADAAEPDAWRLSFNGRPLDVPDLKSFELPAYDADEIHLIQAALRFGPSVAHAEAVVGGDSGDLVDTELTALPVIVDGKPPTADEMAGWFVKDGRPLDVVTVEQGGADIVFVHEATPRLWGKLRRLHKDAMSRGGARDILTRRLTAGLNHEDSLRVVLPIVERAAAATVEQFHISHDFSTIEYGPSTSGVNDKRISGPQPQGVLASFPYPFEAPLRDDAPRQIADAVAVAGQAAAAGRRARAVVLVRGDGTRDHSTHDPATVRRYLERLQVPLLVWSPEKSSDDAWGEAYNIATSRRFLRGVLQLRQALDGQVMVWVRGRHLPHQIELSAEASERLERVGTGSLDIPPEADAEIETWIAQTPFSAEDADDESVLDEPQVAAVDSETGSETPEEATDTEAIGTEEMTLAETEPAGEAVLEGVTIAEPMGDMPPLVETVDVRLVNVDAVVTDETGARHRDLVREEFELYEDDDQVEIRHFKPPRDTAPRVANLDFSETGGDDLKAATRTVPKLVATAEPPKLVIFFDLLRLEAANRKRLAQALREVFAEAPPMQTMIVTYNRTMRVRQPMTTEPMALTAVLDEIERVEPARVGGMDERAWLATELADVQKELVQAYSNEEKRRADARKSAVLVQLDNLTRALAAEIGGTLAAMRQLTASLGGVEGRKLLLYVGDNLELAPTRELYEEAMITVAETEFEASRLRSAAGFLELRRDFDNLLREAHSSGVTFYGVTPKNRAGRDVVERGNYGTTLIAGPAGFQGRLPSARQELVKEAVCRLSIESGGLCQSGGSEPRLLLRETVADAGGGYSLAYAPQRPPDGEFHRLDVEVLRPGLKVRHREGFVDKPAESSLHDRLSASLYFGGMEDGLGVTVVAGEIVPSTSGSESQRSQLLAPLEIRVPVDRLGPVPLLDGEKVGFKARLLVQTRNPEGGISGVQEYPISFQVRGDRLTAQPPLTYAHKLNLLLEPGQHQVAIGLWDEVGRVGSFMSQEVVVSQ